MILLEGLFPGDMNHIRPSLSASDMSINEGQVATIPNLKVRTVTVSRYVIVN